MENVRAINVDQPSVKSKGEGVAPTLRRQPTRGFIRAQNKRARLLEMIPDNALIVAMDLARARHCVWMSTVKKEPLDRYKIPNTPAGMAELLERAHAVQQKYGLGKIVFAMEPTGHYWMPVATYLQERGRPYILVQPLSVKRERESTYYRYAKNDFRDAELIANLTADRKITFTQLPPDPVWAGLKTAALTYVLTEVLMTAEHLRLQSFLERLYPTYPTVFKDATSATALSCLLIMRTLPDIEQMEFLAEARAQSESRLWDRRIDEFYQLITAPGRDWGAPVYDEGLRAPIAQAAERYQLLERQHKEAERELLRFYEKTGYAAYANTIPHLRPVFHAAVLGFIGDPQTLDSSRCVTKFAGVDIKENESGQYHGATPITHRGHPLMRYLAYLAGFILKACDPVFRQRYDELCHRPHRPLRKNQAIVALGCKYLRILWTICKDRVAYDPQKAKHGIAKPDKEVVVKRG